MYSKESCSFHLSGLFFHPLLLIYEDQYSYCIRTNNLRLSLDLFFTNVRFRAEGFLNLDKEVAK